MNKGLFEAQLNAIWDILREIEISEERVKNPQFPEYPRALFKNLNYSEIWKIIFSEHYYNFRLVDNSLIQFRLDSIRPLSIHYAFYEYPYEARISFEEFMIIHPVTDEYDEIRLLEDFENYTNTVNKDSVTPIRYDYDPMLYTPCVHPASHVHIGHNSSIRIGAKRVLRPISFLLLVIRQVYPDYWHRITSLRNANEVIRNVRESLDEVDKSCWSNKDEEQLYVSLTISPNIS